ncbi:MAG: KOW domain-containing RNA-binding protein [Alicyclobacillus sp.]|nr:KOW domain-containing RNA-binding protein [Alicyclobacillus sp.]
MARRPTLPEVGRIVEVIQGRDKGTYGIVIGHVDDRFVWIADGAKRKLDHPKRKNALHVRNTSQIAREIAEAINQNQKVTNAQIRHVMKLFLKGLESASANRVQEGGVPNGEG